MGRIPRGGGPCIPARRRLQASCRGDRRAARVERHDAAHTDVGHRVDGFSSRDGEVVNATTWNCAMRIDPGRTRLSPTHHYRQVIAVAIVSGTRTIVRLPISNDRPRRLLEGPPRRQRSTLPVTPIQRRSGRRYRHANGIERARSVNMNPSRASLPWPLATITSLARRGRANHWLGGGRNAGHDSRGWFAPGRGLDRRRRVQRRDGRILGRAVVHYRRERFPRRPCRCHRLVRRWHARAAARELYVSVSVADDLGSPELRGGSAAAR